MQRTLQSYLGQILKFRTALAAALVAAAMCMCRPADAALIAYWKLDGSSSVSLADSSGNGHNLVAAPATNTTVMPHGGAGVGTDNSPSVYTASHYTNPLNQTGSTSSASFDGTDALITTNTLNLSSQSQITIEWFQQGTGNETYPWFSGNPADVNGATGGFSFASEGTFRDFGSGAPRNLQVPSMDGSWHEFAVTLDSTGGAGTKVALYEDYNLVDSTTASAVPFSNTQFVIGKDYYGDAERHFVGQIAELSISSGILAPGQFVSQQVVPEPSSFVALGIAAAASWSVVGRRRVG